MNQVKVAIVAIACAGCRAVLIGHEVSVHQEITRHAADTALAYSISYAAFLDTVSTDCPLEDATNSLIEGSAREDDTWKDDGGIRTFNHFYDPLTRQGLSNFPPDDRIAPFGNDSFTWAWTRNCPGIDFLRLVGNLGLNVDTHNSWSWQNARDEEWVGLTARNPSDRHNALTNMFRMIGQVVHLLQDTSQPQHVRNEQHLPPLWQSPIENYGGTNDLHLNYQHGMLPWKADGFTKLEDFWNRGRYNGQDSSALVADAGTTGVSAARLG